jgi:hypothetical protein
MNSGAALLFAPRLIIATLVGGLLATGLGMPPPRRAQEVCKCKTCVDLGNTAQQCLSLGLDCGCLVTCACQACLHLGNTADECRSLGLDCTGCDGDTTGGDTCGEGICADDPTWVSSFHGACADYGPAGKSAGFCAKDSGVGRRGATVLASEACPVTCNTCPPTFDERQTAVTAECCGGTKNCGLPDHLLGSITQDCATEFLSFFDECHDDLLTKYQHGISQFDGTVAKCQATAKACAAWSCQNGAVCSARGPNKPQAECSRAQELCGAARRASVGNCLVCFQQHGMELAICQTSTTADSFCQRSDLMKAAHTGPRQLLQGGERVACACLDNFYGPTCATFCKAADTCSGKGQCRPSDGTCSCQAEYYGPACATFCTAADTCSGKGTCSAAGACACQPGYTKDANCQGAHAHSATPEFVQ